MKAEFTVIGEPVGKARPRVTRMGHAYTPAKTVLYENLIKVEYERQCGEQRASKPEGVSLSVAAYFQTPSSVSRKKRESMLNGEIRPTKKPDADNILKCVGDALNGVAFDDDSQIVQCHAEKWYSDTPRLVVIVRSV